MFERSWLKLPWIFLGLLFTNTWNTLLLIILDLNDKKDLVVSFCSSIHLWENGAADDVHKAKKDKKMLCLPYLRMSVWTLLTCRSYCGKEVESMKHNWLILAMISLQILKDRKQ